MEAKKKKWKRAVVVTGGILALCGVGLFALVQVENHRGRSAWERYQKEAAARGESLTVAPPPEIPEDENFAATPFFQSLFESKEAREAVIQKIDLRGPIACKDWPSLGLWQLGQSIEWAEWQAVLGTENLREALAKFSPVIEEVSVASRRPKTRFPLNYDNALAMETPHFSGLLKLSSLLTLRAKLSLAEGKSEEALADLKLIFRLGDAASIYPLLVSQLVYEAINRGGLNVIWEGLVSKQWRKSDLEQIRASLQEVLNGSNIVTALQGERSAFNQFWQKSKADCSHWLAFNAQTTSVGAFLLPNEGWHHQNQVSVNRNYQQIIDGLSQRPIDQKSLVVKPSAIKVYSALSDVIFPLDHIIVPSLATTVSVQQALLACALEEYRMDHGSLPQSLSKLVPSHLDNLPLDPLTAQPQIYRLTDGGSYLLYSVGWNLKDDGGVVVMKGEKQRDEAQGDWVWYGSPQINLTKE